MTKRKAEMDVARLEDVERFGEGLEQLVAKFATHIIFSKESDESKSRLSLNKQLALAVQECNKIEIQSLLEQGAEIDKSDSYGRTPIHLALYTATRHKKLDKTAIEIAIKMLAQKTIKPLELLPKTPNLYSYPNILKFFDIYLDEIQELKPIGLEQALLNLSKSLEKLTNLTSETKPTSPSEEIRLQLLKPKIETATPMANSLRERLEIKLQEINLTEVIHPLNQEVKKIGDEKPMLDEMNTY